MTVRISEGAAGAGAGAVGDPGGIGNEGDDGGLHHNRRAIELYLLPEEKSTEDQQKGGGGQNGDAQNGTPKESLVPAVEGKLEVLPPKPSLQHFHLKNLVCQSQQQQQQVSLSSAAPESGIVASMPPPLVKPAASNGLVRAGVVSNDSAPPAASPIDGDGDSAPAAPARPIVSDSCRVSQGDDALARSSLDDGSITRVTASPEARSVENQASKCDTEMEAAAASKPAEDKKVGLIDTEKSDGLVEHRVGTVGSAQKEKVNTQKSSSNIKNEPALKADAKSVHQVLSEKSVAKNAANDLAVSTSSLEGGMELNGENSSSIIITDASAGASAANRSLLALQAEATTPQKREVAATLLNECGGGDSMEVDDCIEDETTTVKGEKHLMKENNTLPRDLHHKFTNSNDSVSAKTENESSPVTTDEEPGKEHIKVESRASSKGKCVSESSHLSSTKKDPAGAVCTVKPSTTKGLKRESSSSKGADGDTKLLKELIQLTECGTCDTGHKNALSDLLIFGPGERQRRRTVHKPERYEDNWRHKGQETEAQSPNNTPSPKRKKAIT